MPVGQMGAEVVVGEPVRQGEDLTAERHLGSERHWLWDSGLRLIAARRDRGGDPGRDRPKIEVTTCADGPDR
jgi:hypothetical protein